MLVTHAVSPSAGCASSCPQNCLFLWYPLIYPIKPVCGAACGMGHVIGLIIMGGGHCLILGLLLPCICPLAWFSTQVMQVETAPLGNFILLNHTVNSGQRLFLIERDMFWKPQTNFPPVNSYPDHGDIFTKGNLFRHRGLKLTWLLCLPAFLFRLRISPGTSLGSSFCWLKNVLTWKHDFYLLRGHQYV